MKTPITPQGLPPYIYGWEAGPDEKVWNEAAVREALAAQATTLESIHKIIECAGPEAADEIADLLGYPSVEWPSDQALTAPNLACKSAQARLATQWGYVRAASVEPVGKIINSGGNTGSLPEHPLLVWLGGVPPVGTELYAGAPPAHIPADAPVWNSIQIASWIGSQLMHEPAMFERSAVCKFVRSLGRHPTLLKHSPQPQAVDAVDEPWVVFDSQGYYAWHSTEVSAKEWCEHYNARSADDPLKPYVCRRISECAALQASRQPQPQAVDAEGERIDALKQVDRFFVERLAELGCLSPEAGAVHAMVRAALQASHQPQPQQAVGDQA